MTMHPPPKIVPGKEAPPALRILVVEDHPDTRLGLKLFLETLGHRAVFAEDVRSGLAAARAGEFDLLLSDISLPDGDGWDLLRKLDAANRRPPRTAAMSGFSTAADLAKSKAAGFHSQLIKPFTPEELEAVLREAANALAVVRPA